MENPPPESDISGPRDIIGRGFLTPPILWRPLTSPLTHAPYIVYSHLSNFVQPFFKFSLIFYYLIKMNIHMDSSSL